MASMGDTPGKPWALKARHELSERLTQILLDPNRPENHKQHVRSMKENKAKYKGIQRAREGAAQGPKEDMEEDVGRG